jgi:aminopeptidase-like protein
MEALDEGMYEVCIDSSLKPGALSYGEYVIPGETDDEVLFSCHTCHPSLCNDNLSGVALCTFLARRLQEQQPRYTYRFVFVPGTIGAITWLARNEAHTDRITHGLVVACVGDPGAFHYKRSRRDDAEIDRVVQYVLEQSSEPFDVRPFTPYGYDERQYCSPGFNLPVGSLTRTPHGRFPEYHTSADNLDFVQPDALAQSLERYLEVIRVLEQNRTYISNNPKGEPQLGRRGLYREMGGHTDTEAMQMAMLWVLNLADGTHSLLDMAVKSDLPFLVLEKAADTLSNHDLLR